MRHSDVDSLVTLRPHLPTVHSLAYGHHPHGHTSMAKRRYQEHAHAFRAPLPPAQLLHHFISQVRGLPLERWVLQEFLEEPEGGPGPRSEVPEVNLVLPGNLESGNV